MHDMEHPADHSHACSCQLMYNVLFPPLACQYVAEYNFFKTQKKKRSDEPYFPPSEAREPNGIFLNSVITT